ncbi:MAG TPA: right-handed parallel beta-helix repeat-containing protein, partial [Acidimicrobiales bacterium]|nr:right-handed parallel beta-helix repeat-containing protein [Acidimicrobiales bacterium]
MKYNLASHPRRGGRATAEARKRRWRLQPTLLALEDRRLLSTWTVTSTLDDGSTGTLRWAIGQANSAGGAETINFDPTVFATPQTITLNGTQLELSDTTGTETVTGPAAGVTVSGNNASRVFQVDPGVTASISGLTISAGQTDSAGAGMFNSGNTTLIDCTISGNTAGTGSGTAQGGGIDNNGTLSLTSSTISGNRAYGYYDYSHGGGIENSGLLTVTGSTIWGNSAPYPGGGGIENSGGTVTLTDTIVAGNDYGDIVGPVTGTYNLIGTGGSGGLVNGVNGNLVGVDNPGLGALGNYGGQTETIPLLPGSPAIDAGTSAGATATDQRGEPRVGGIDIGAFESQGFTMTALAGSTPQSAAIGSAFAGPLGVALTANNPVEPVDGGVVTFVADPATDGASVAFLSATSVVIAGGQVTVSAAPNNMDGSYTATASILGLPTATFDLTNTGPVFAKLTVNTTSDALFPGAGLLSLREAITFANFDLVGNTNITFSRTVFSSPQTITLTGAQLELSNTSEPETITGQKARVTISGAGLSRVFLVDDLVTASLSGLTITGGNVGYGTGGGGGGGLANFGTTTLTGCTVTGNTSYSAGGLFNGGTTTLKDCIISDNSTTGFIGRGGGMLNSGAATLNDCTVSGNTAALGGGLYANYAAVSTALSGCTISNNASNGIGGGLFLFGKSNLTDCTVTDNNANGSNAGAHFAIWSGVQ